MKSMYDHFARNYDLADQFGALSESHKIAIAQIQDLIHSTNPHYRALDIGVGDGCFLKKLTQLMPNAQFTGIDVSAEMLKQAKKTVDLTAIEASITEADQYIPRHSQDLAAAHFVNAYVPICNLFESVKSLLKANGYFSFITTTYDSFPVAQQFLADFVAQGTLLSSVVGHYYKSIAKNTTVASSERALLESFAQHDFEVVAHERLHLPIVLDDIDALALFGIEGTWFLNTLSIKMLPKSFIVKRLKWLSERIFTFPYHDTHVIDVVLAKK